MEFGLVRGGVRTVGESVSVRGSGKVGRVHEHL
jgi:hypothetical protein